MSTDPADPADPVRLRELVHEVVADLIAAELHPEGPCLR